MNTIYTQLDKVQFTATLTTTLYIWSAAAAPGPRPMVARPCTSLASCWASLPHSQPCLMMGNLAPWFANLAHAGQACPMVRESCLILGKLAWCEVRLASTWARLPGARPGSPHPGQACLVRGKARLTLGKLAWCKAKLDSPWARLPSARQSSPHPGQAYLV